MWLSSVPGVLQTNGATALYIASREGLLEVVRALVGEGVALNQSEVSDGGSVVRGRLCVVHSKSYHVQVFMCMFVD
jgi:hypothetical protein